MKTTKHMKNITTFLVTMLMITTIFASFPTTLAASKDWTFMVYICADNDLESFGINDFLEMSSIGSDSNVNIIVQFDRAEGYDSSYGDWTSTKRFYITPGMTPTSSNAISDIGEADMGDPSTLSNFLIWGFSNYPADNYAAILWDHGDGWRSKDSNETVLKGCCFDASSENYLSVVDIEDALYYSLAYTGKEPDLIGFDACLMAMAEIDYQIRHRATIRVASEETEPGDGWPYDTILDKLTTTPSMTPYTLGNKIVGDYIDSYPDSSGVTMSSVDLSQYDTLTTAIETFSNELISKISIYPTKIENARDASQEFFYGILGYIDIYDFAYEIHSRISDSSIRNAAQAVMDAVDTVVNKEDHGSQCPDANGISIYFPDNPNDYNSAYETDLEFTDNLLWDEFLGAYLYGDSLVNLVEAITCKWVNDYQDHGPKITTFNYDETIYAYAEAEIMNGDLYGKTMRHEWWYDTGNGFTERDEWEITIDDHYTSWAMWTWWNIGLEYGPGVGYIKICLDGEYIGQTNEYTVIGPELQYSPTTINFGNIMQGETDSETFHIWKNGEGPLEYTIDEYANWIEVSPTSGTSTGEVDTITVTLENTESLSLGTHETTIEIESNGGNGEITVLVNIIENDVEGDMNNDGTLNSGDVRYLALYLCGDPEYKTLYADGDVNNDEKINSGDVRYLALYLCGDPDYQPLYPSEQRLDKGSSNTDCAAWLNISDAQIPVGSSSSILLSADDVAEATGSCNVNISWDSNIITVTNVSNSDFDGLNSYVDTTNGSLSIVVYDTSGLSDTFCIAEITCESATTISITSEVSIETSELSSDDPYPIDITHNTNNATVTVYNGEETIDINQQLSNRGLPIRHALDGNWAAAQSFIPTNNVFTRAEIHLRKFGTPEFDLVIELRKDHPQGTILDSITIPISEAPSSWEWVNLDFDDITVTPGTEYFIVCPPAPSGVTNSFGYEWGYALGNQYDDGAFWFTRDGGGLWRDLPTLYEYAFKTYGYY